MFGRLVLACSVALLGATVSLRALAEPPPSAPLVRWDAPASCPPGDLTDRVASLVGLGHQQLAARLLRVDAVASPTETGVWLARLRIETVAGSGERSFAAEDCRSLVDAVALILALTVDPSAVTQRGGLPSKPPVELGAQPSAKTARPRPRFLLRPLLAADIGILPDVALAYGLAAGLAWPTLRLEVDDSYRSAQTVSDGRGHSGRVSIPIDSSARVCAAPWRWSSVEPGGCVGTAVTWLRTTGGKDLAVAETHDTLSVAVTAGAAVALRLRDWLYLRADAYLGVMVRRPNLQVASASRSVLDVYSARWWNLRLGGGLELRL
jgi:hypothetical protein